MAKKTKCADGAKKRRERLLYLSALKRRRAGCMFGQEREKDLKRFDCLA